MIPQLIKMAKLVWVLDVTSSGGIDDSVETGYIGGFLICPKAFPVTIRIRSPEHASIVKRELEDIRSFLETFKE